MEEADRCDDSNAIHRWNILKSGVMEKPILQKPFQPDGREARTS